MRVLELFKGTGSFGRYIESEFPDWEVVSLDIMSKYKPTICCDILDWDYGEWDGFDIIWASPECKIYCLMQDSFQWRLYGNTFEEAKLELTRLREDHYKYTDCVFEIIDYFKPKYWFIENPLTSKLKYHPKLRECQGYRYDYCRFGYEYQKPTRIWSNVDIGNYVCECVGRHKRVIGRFGDHSEGSLKERYSIPRGLFETLFSKLDLAE